MSEADSDSVPFEALEIPLERDGFCRNLIRELAGTLEDVVGQEEASGFFSVVGQTIGRQIDADYRRALGVERLNRQQVEQALVDLKARIQGDFYVIYSDAEKIELGNFACPFGDKVIGQRCMCMMTSNVFGSIAADNLGYAKVVLDETIADGYPGCKVRVYLQQGGESQSADGREYFKSDDN